MTSICYLSKLAEIFLHEIHNRAIAHPDKIPRHALLTVRCSFDEAKWIYVSFPYTSGTYENL